MVGARTRWLVRLITPVAVLVLIAVGVVQLGRVIGEFRRAALRSSSYAVAVTDRPGGGASTGGDPAPTLPDPAGAAAGQLLTGISRVVALGDSVPAGSACECTAYPRLVAQQLADRTGRPVSSSNLAVGGATTQDVLDDLTDPQVQSAIGAADLVIIQIGANDFDTEPAADPECDGPELPCYRAALAAVSDRLTRIADTVRALQPGSARLALLGYWNVFLDGAAGRAEGQTYVTNSDRLSRAFNTALAAVAARSGARYVDAYAPFKGDGSIDPTPLLAEDGDHPNRAGHQALAGAVLSALTTALASAPMPAAPSRPPSRPLSPPAAP